MNTKDIVDIDAFTKGLTKTTMSLGLIIPVAAVRYIINMAIPLAPGMLGMTAVQSIGDIFLFNVLSSH